MVTDTMCKIISLVVFFYGVIKINGYLLKREVNSCTTPNNLAGTCVPFTDCPSLQAVYNKNNNSAENLRFLVSSQRNCGIRSNDYIPIVCCQNRIDSVPRLDDCVTQNSEPGECIDIRQCEAYIEILEKQQLESRTFLRDSNKICDADDTVVCCPKRYDSTPRIGRDSQKVEAKSYHLPTPKEDNCGTIHANTRIIGLGTELAKLNSWPWVALIGYKNDSNITTFDCQGSIITRRHILAAAHCIKSDLHLVRLGEYDLLIDTETQHEEITVSNAIIHPDYNDINRNNDIAILILSQEISFRDGIGPVCIPTDSTLQNKNYTGFHPILNGWASVDESSNMMKLSMIPVIGKNICESQYMIINTDSAGKLFDESIRCAGLPPRPAYIRKCQEDSGAPLSAPEEINSELHFFQIGLISYEIGCAFNQDLTIYTSVQHFSNWISNRVSQPVF